MNNNKKKPHRHRQQYGDYQREREWGQVEQGKGKIKEMEGDLTLGGEYTILYNIQMVYYRIVELKPI